MRHICCVRSPRCLSRFPAGRDELSVAERGSERVACGSVAFGLAACSVEWFNGKGGSPKQDAYCMTSLGQYSKVG